MFWKRFPGIWFLPSLAVLLLLGAFEAAYGRSDYSGDAISYLDLSHAISEGHWKLAFNSLWSIGYPLLLCFTRLSPSPVSEWNFIHLLNLLILAGTYFSGLFLLDAMLAYQDVERTNRSHSRFIFIAYNCIFFSIELGINLVSRVSPDMLVVCFYLLASGAALWMLKRPCLACGVLLGFSLGLGFLAKSIFLPVALIQLGLLALAVLIKKQRPWPVLISAAAFLLFAIPYGVALSWANGYPTAGDAGSLNYAFHVNGLQHWANWQGGPAEFGTPLHPTRRLMTELPLFAFAEPFPVTYSPQLNMPYWYRGYRRVFHLSNQMAALRQNRHELSHILQSNAIFPAIAVAAILLFVGTRSPVLLQNILRFWPVGITALGILFSYLLMWVEARYLCGFLLLLALVLPVAGVGIKSSMSFRLRAGVLAILIVGCAINLITAALPPVRAAIHGQTRAKDPQWIAGEWIVQHGFRHGDRVGAIANETNMHCTWAYISGLRIVAEVASGNHSDYDAGHDVEEFWSAPLEVRTRALNLFQSNGAVAVFSIGKPSAVIPGSGWIEIPSTDIWVYRFAQN
jgi:hypothetical protein